MTREENAMFKSGTSKKLGKKEKTVAFHEAGIGRLEPC